MIVKRLIGWFVPFAIGAFIASIGLFVGVRTAHAQGSSNCESTNTAPATFVENCNGHRGVYGIEMRVVNAQMVAHPNPGLTPLPTDDKMLYQRAYRKVLKATDVYNAPGGGGVVSHLDGGFNFVNAGQLQNGFVEIRPGQWVPNDVLGPVNKAVSHFSGVALPDGGMPAIGFGWVLDDDTKVSLWPGAKPLPNTPIIHRYTMVNFFATVDVDGWEWYMIGPRQWIIQKHVAYPHLAKRPDGVSGKWFAVDLFEQTLVAYQDDKPTFATMISSGLPKFKTDEGLFKILSRYEEVKMSGASGQPDFYYLPQVPFVQYFNQDEQALHGAYWHDYFGWPRSHGCVNMSLTDAQWAFNWTKDDPQAFVYVYHSHDPKAGTGSLK